MNRIEPKGLLQACLPLTLFGLVFIFVLGFHIGWPEFSISTAKAVPFSTALALLLTTILSPTHRMKTIKTFMLGMGQKMMLQMGLIFVLSGIFAVFGQAIGSIDAIVAISLYILPENAILPGLFAASCITSLAMGTSMGTLAAVSPIALGIAASGGGTLPVCLATVIGGAIFGDNLSVVSDTTIAATKTQGCSMRSKLIFNVPVALLAAATTVVILLLLASPQKFLEPIPEPISWSVIWPYVSVLFLALCGVPVQWILATGIGLCLLIALGQETLSLSQLIDLAITGILSMLDVLLATFFVAGLIQVAQERGGLQALLNSLQQHVRSKRGAEASIAVLAIIADICTANNTIAILLCGPLVKRIGKQFRINRARCASILDICACIPQGLLPYGAQMLLVTGLADISPFQVLPYVIYPLVLALFVGIEMTCRSMGLFDRLY